MGPANNLIYLIQHLSGVLAKQADQLLQEQVGLGFSQYKILLVLEWNPRVQQKTIAVSLGQTEASVSRQVKLLQVNGLVVSKLDPLNRRKHITTPSLRGMQVTEAATNALHRSLGSEFTALGDPQLSQVLLGLQNLHTIVCKAGKTGACNHPLGF